MKKTNADAGLTRRATLVLGSAGLAALALRTAGAADGGEAALAALEHREGGRLGVVIYDTANGRRVGHRPDERFLMCSTFKFLAAAAILQRVDAGAERLDRPLKVEASDIIPHSPVAEKHVGGALTIGELCHATITTSDNAAANLLIGTIGGPEAVTAFARSLGDTVTRLDRLEPMLNDSAPAGPDFDTTSPAAMAATMHAVLLGDVLTASSRNTITGWLKAAETGLNRLRGGFPADWVAGDKTGTGMDGPTNDIAIAWPPGRAPLIVTAYYDRTGRTTKENAAVLAEVGRIAASSF